MDRRNFLRNAAGGAALAALGAPGLSSAAGSPPNIVIIMADDLGYGDLGCYGSEAIATPHLDRLADQGMKMTSFFASAPTCSPSRAGLLTGRYPVRAGVTGVYFPSRNPLVTLPFHAVSGLGPGMNTRELILPELLKPAGYKSCCIGKWHLGDMKHYRPHHRGFDHYFGLLYSNDMTPLPLYRNDEVVERHPVDQNFLTRKYTEEALDWLDDNHDRPFLLYIPHTFPHIPLYASPEFRGRSAGGLYGDTVEELDWSVGQVMAALDKHGIADNTFVFFTSDNGPWYQGSPGGRRGRKGEIFDGGMNVPGIAAWPGVIPAGAVSNEMSMNFDLFATALALAGVEPPDDRVIDGRNIMPLLRQETPTPHEALYFYHGRKPWAVRTPRWKYHRRHPLWTTGHAVVPRGPFLFDLENDPDESYDVSMLHPEVARELDEMMTQWNKNFVKGLPR